LLAAMPENEEIKRAQIEVCLLIAGPMFHLGFPEDSLEILQTGELHSKEVDDKKSLTLFLSLIGQYYAWKGGDLRQAIQYSENSFNEAEKINDIDLMAPIGADLSFLYFWMGDYFKVNYVASKVIVMLEKMKLRAEFFGRPYNVYSFLLAQHSTCSWRMGNFEEGKALFDKGLEFALKIKDLFSLGLLEGHHGWDFNFKGDARPAIEHLQKSIEYCEEGQIVNLQVPLLFGLGLAYWLSGKLDVARDYVEKGIKAQIESGVPHDIGFFYGSSGMVFLDSGDLNKARQLAEEKA